MIDSIRFFLFSAPHTDHVWLLSGRPDSYQCDYRHLDLIARLIESEHPLSIYEAPPSAKYIHQLKSICWPLRDIIIPASRVGLGEGYTIATGSRVKMFDIPIEELPLLNSTSSEENDKRH